MRSIEILENVIKEYSWGSHTVIADLLGQTSPSDTPQAELWMGAHPSAPSMIEQSGEKIALNELIEKYPEDVLGKNAYEKFGHQLPFLLKVLAVEKPLSIQVHPNAKQASEGFKNENKKGIPLDSQKRNYKDSNHKPECICAVTDFWALNGFRSIPDIVSHMEYLSHGMIDSEIAQLSQNRNEKGLECFFQFLMEMSAQKRERLISTVVSNAKNMNGEKPACDWIVRLHMEYGENIGVIFPLLLNLIHLKPGQAMFLSFGVLHAYLKGTGIEVMANSDNVIRGGLTSKHVDIHELNRIVNFNEKTIELIAPVKITEGEWAYPCEAEEFILTNLQLNKGTDYFSLQERNVEIMICVKGKATIESIPSGEKVIIEKGKSVLIPAAAGRYTIKGEAVLYKSTVPLE